MLCLRSTETALIVNISSETLILSWKYNINISSTF